ncbi:MAG: hypothetical protein L0332_34565 [Chloroflexi bacterium]|nr:hypothetical protein [Chloroflexota bacterium]
MDYTRLPWLRLARRYLAGESARSLAAEVGSPDHKTFQKHLTKYVFALGGAMRGRNEAQQARRWLELHAGDVYNWKDYALGNNFIASSRGTR